MLNTWEVDPAPTFYPNCVFANKPNDLFVYFWLSTAIERKSGEFLSILMNLDTVGYLSENFRRPWVIDYKGRPLLVEPQSIDDFQAGAFIPTPVTVLAEGANSNCCDLPCGCSFTECEYYQDFGAYMYQSTLDTLKISSFIVDGIELIGTPVGFGLLSIIDIGGEPYVTNLVDTLNSIGAPYFSFAYSDRAHISKGLRFFKIKRPSCYTFSITIQESGVDVYLYTESSQGSKAFSGTYEGFGYNEITEPENCQVTKEYV